MTKHPLNTTVSAQVQAAGWRFHHIGCATRSMAQEQLLFYAMGYTLEAEPFVDSVQGVRGCFLIGAGPRIELLEGLEGSSTLRPWLDAGIRFYHMAYEVPDLDHSLTWVRQQRGRITVQPVPAVAFGGRKICFAIFRNKVFLELIEM